MCLYIGSPMCTECNSSPIMGRSQCLLMVSCSGHLWLWSHLYKSRQAV